MTMHCARTREAADSRIIAAAYGANPVGGAAARRKQRLEALGRRAAVKMRLASGNRREEDRPPSDECGEIVPA